jgi:hypothetical protein
LEGTGREAGRDCHDSVFNLAAMPVVLTLHSHRVCARFGGARLINDADRTAIGMFVCDQPSASPEHLLVVPLNRLQESLQRPGGDSLSQRDGLDILALQI